MKKTAFASIVALAAFVAQNAIAQTPAQRDRAIAKLTDSRDMSTGLAMNAPAQPASGWLSGTARDRAIEKLTNARDMSTGFVK